MIVLLAGPDGSGKSAVAAHLRRTCGEVFHGSTGYHWRPGLLPQPGRILGRRKIGEVTAPHSQPLHCRPVSCALTFWYLADFLFDRLARVLRPRLRGTLVVVERGWWDMVVDPRRYRLSLPPPLIRALGRLVPRPDLLVVLDAPAGVLAARKRELPEPELERQRDAWLALSVPGVDKVVLDATRPLEEVVAQAREAIMLNVERRGTARFGPGWANLPSRGRTRWWLPRGPRRTALRGIAIYHPVTRIGRAGWELARLLARGGGFRLLLRGEAPPQEVRARLADYLPPRTTYAAMRANHRGRYIALLVDENGKAMRIAKVATTAEGEVALRREARAIEAYGRLLDPPVRAPRVLLQGGSVLLLEAARFRPRGCPWRLPTEVARALGVLERAGISHGDAAPWNLLAATDGFVLLDWEEAGPRPTEGWDLLHWLVQAHALLGRPRLEEILAALEGRGPLGPAVRSFLEAAGLDASRLRASVARYLERSASRLDVSRPDGVRALAARRRLAEALGMSIERGAVGEQRLG